MNTKAEKTFKFIVAPVGIILAVLALIYGAFLPFRKSQLFIQAMRQSREVTSVVNYMDTFNRALDFSSPAGHAEDIRFLENQIGGVIAQKPPQEIADALVAYADSVSRVSKSGSYALNYVQEVVILGNIHATNFRNYKEKRDYDAALALFQGGLTLSPNRPQFLYGLLQLFMDAGESENAKEVARKILSIWPGDKNVAAIMDGGNATSTK